SLAASGSSPEATAVSGPLPATASSTPTSHSRNCARWRRALRSPPNASGLAHSLGLRRSPFPPLGADTARARWRRPPSRPRPPHPPPPRAWAPPSPPTRAERDFGSAAGEGGNGRDDDRHADFGA